MSVFLSSQYCCYLLLLLELLRGNSATAGRLLSLSAAAANSSALERPHKCDTAPPLADAVSQGGVKQQPCSERIGRGSKRKVAIWLFPLLKKKIAFYRGIIEHHQHSVSFLSSRGRRWERTRALRSDRMFLTLQSFHHSSKTSLTSPGARCGSRATWSKSRQTTGPLMLPSGAETLNECVKSRWLAKTDRK